MIPPAGYEHLSIEEAIAFQHQLRTQISIGRLDEPVHTIGGADVSFNKYSDVVFAGIVVLSYPELHLLERAAISSRTRFPYVPGLLAFREVPSLLEAWNKLQRKPDVMILDGQGIAHERRTGIATHFGLLTGVPSIGCAKSRLTGRFEEPGSMLFAQSPMWHGNEQVGIALRSKPGCTPLYISPGHRLDLEQSVEIVKNCIRKHRMPEPTRLAHLLVNQKRIAADEPGPSGLFD